MAQLVSTLLLIYTGLELERVFYPGHMSVVVVAIWYGVWLKDWTNAWACREIDSWGLSWRKKLRFFCLSNLSFFYSLLKFNSSFISLGRFIIWIWSVCWPRWKGEWIAALISHLDTKGHILMQYDSISKVTDKMQSTFFSLMIRNVPVYFRNTLNRNPLIILLEN